MDFCICSSGYRRHPETGETGIFDIRSFRMTGERRTVDGGRETYNLTIARKACILYWCGSALSSIVRKMTTVERECAGTDPVYNIFLILSATMAGNILESRLVYENGTHYIDWVDLEGKLSNFRLHYVFMQLTESDRPYLGRKNS